MPNVFGPITTAKPENRPFSQSAIKSVRHSSGLGINRKNEWRRSSGLVADTLARIADHKITRIDELLPWRYAASAA